MARKRRHQTKIEHDNLDRWLVSYADFITLLFAFFVVMYAISSVNTGKYRILSDSIVESFDGAPVDVVEEDVQDDRDSELTAKKKSDTENLIELPIPDEFEEKEHNNQNPTLTEISTEVKNSVVELMAQGLINITQDENWLEIEIKSSILFEIGNSKLSEDAEDVLAKLASIIKVYPNQLQIEGYTDDVPINSPRFPSNWELSSARAASVVHLFEAEGVDPNKMQAIGYGKYKPKTSNDTAAGRRENRRVVLVVLGSDNTRKVTKVNANQASKIGEVDAYPSSYNAETQDLISD
ncbi:MAG: flagellar motor protein MotD [Gammaproteobacteria bacterium]|nr:flagellar motor protein MotD [Gammaproteobacteria bacterium]